MRWGIIQISVTTHELGEDYKAKYVKVSHIVVDDQLRGSQALKEEWWVLYKELFFVCFVADFDLKV